MAVLLLTNSGWLQGLPKLGDGLILASTTLAAALLHGFAVQDPK